MNVKRVLKEDTEEFFNPIKEQDLKQLNKKSILNAFNVVVEKTKAEAKKKNPKSVTELKTVKDALTEMSKDVVAVENLRFLIENYVQNIPANGEAKKDTIIFINVLIDVYNEVYSSLINFLNSVKKFGNYESVKVQEKLIDALNKQFNFKIENPY